MWRCLNAHQPDCCFVMMLQVGRIWTGRPLGRLGCLCRDEKVALISTVYYCTSVRERDALLRDNATASCKLERAKANS